MFRFQSLCSMLAGALLSVHAAELKVDLNPADRKGDALSPHWENWPCREGTVLSNKFGEITVVFRATNGAVFVPLLNKAALDYAAHMAADGIATRGSGSAAFDMVIGGLRPGKHTVATYHNEMRDVKPTSLSIWVGDKAQVEDVVPSRRATNDYEVASAFFEVEAVAGRDVLIRVETSKHQAPSSREAPNPKLQTPYSGKIDVRAPEPGPEREELQRKERAREESGRLVINGFE